MQVPARSGQGAAGPWLLALPAMVAAGDLILWQVGTPRLGLAALTLGIGLVAQAAAGPPSRNALRIGWPLFLLCLLPVVEEPTPLSLTFLVAGTAQLAAWIAAGDAGWPGIRAALLLPFRGLVQAARDIVALARGPRGWTGTEGRIGSLLRDWAPALVLGLVFAGLIALANPVVDRWVQGLGGWRFLPDLSLSRLVLWVMLAVALWPFLRLGLIPPRAAAPPRPPAIVAAILTEGAVTRALYTFNLLFLVQTAMDLTYLWGGVHLPAGMTYAEYAHRGAYPLLATALLAGAFALLAQPHLGGRRDLRMLLLLWVGQNLLLVCSSLLRLDLYVGGYGLTRLRFAAAVWMGIVAIGLAVMLVQVATGRRPGWMIARSAVAGAVTLWAVCFVNVDGLIARTNLALFGDRADFGYLCHLSDGALPALADWTSVSGQNGVMLCHDLFWYVTPEIREPQDWREWGFRNWRLRHSLTGAGGNP